MLNFFNKKGKKVMEMKDDGRLKVEELELKQQLEAMGADVIDEEEESEDDKKDD